MALLAASAATSGLPVTIDNREQHFHFHAARLVQADFDGKRKSLRFWDSGMLFIAIVNHCRCLSLICKAMLQPRTCEENDGGWSGSSGSWWDGSWWSSWRGGSWHDDNTWRESSWQEHHIKHKGMSFPELCIDMLEDRGRERDSQC